MNWKLLPTDFFLAICIRNEVDCPCLMASSVLVIASLGVIHDVRSYILKERTSEEVTCSEVPENNIIT